MRSPAAGRGASRASVLVTLGVLVAATAACGSAPGPTATSVNRAAAAPATDGSGSGHGAAGQSTAGHGTAGHGAHGGGDRGGQGLWAVQTGPLGVVATDDAGNLLYRFDGDSAAPPVSRCTDACATTWTPLLIAPDVTPELMGVDAKAVGHVTRPDGSLQLTLGGWPLYRNAQDRPGLTDTGHHGTDGRWFVATPTGAKAPT